MPNAQCVLAIDPGRAKCGVAVVDSAYRVLYRAILTPDDLLEIVPELVARFQPIAIPVGNGTGAAPLLATLNRLLPDTPPLPVEEHHTSEQARALWLADHPPQGWARLLPRSLRSPDTPYDDYVAVILAERWWMQQTQAASPHEGTDPSA